MTRVARQRNHWSLGPGDTAAIPGVRRGIMAVLRADAVCDADLSSAEIVVGELLSNAVTHTRGPAFVSLRWDGDHPLVSVWDEGPGPALIPPLPSRLPDDDLADRGRGMFLVVNLALDVRIDAGRAGGSRVSVRLDVPHS